MANAPNLKIYSPHHGYIGCVKFGEDAACLVALQGNGATIRDGHNKRDTVWTEGSEDFSAAESYDRVATIIKDRIESKYAAARAAREVAANRPLPPTPGEMLGIKHKSQPALQPDEPPSKCSGLCKGKQPSAHWNENGFCNYCGEDGNA